MFRAGPSDQMDKVNTMPRNWKPFGLGLAALAATVLATAALAQPVLDDPFSFANKAEIPDPFSPEFQAQPGGKVQPGPPKVSRKTQALAERITFEVKVTPEKASPGEVVRMIVTGKPKKGFHTYPITSRTKDQLETQLSQMALSASSELKPLWPIRETTPTPVDEGKSGILLEHPKEFTWEQDILILPGAKPGLKKLDLTITLQVCDENNCLAGTYLPLEVAVQVGEGEVPLSADLKKRLQEGPPEVAVVAPGPVTPRASSPSPKSTPATDQRAEASGGLLGLLGAAFAGAFLMLLTPCVFPMVPITVNFFLKQSEKDHHRPLSVASVYSGTIIILLTLVILALGKVVIALANDPWFNLALGAVLIFFALSLFGMYEIELPSFLARFTSAREGQGGYLGAIFMALTFTITSFTCTGPFLGALLGGVASMRPPFLHLVLASVVYSATFAAPFFFLALFPSVMKKLPKSGGWLNAIKVTMGFLELGAALKFLSNTDMAFNPGAAILFNFDTVLCAWIALSIACGLYLFGIFRLPHDDKTESIGVLRMIFATLFIGMGIYLMPILYGGKPQGIVAQNVIAFLPLRTGPGATGSGAADRLELAWHLDYIDGWKEAQRDHKLIFIDFTGVNCTNCRDNEENVFPSPRVHEQLKKYVRVRLYTDTVPKPGLSPGQAKEQADRNAHWQDALVGDLTNPFYVILNPNPKDPFTGDGLLNGSIVDKRNGKVFDLNGFVAFLQAPQARNGASADAGSGRLAALRE
jgi:thiol:disulfide interchange protein DsbD